MSADNGIYILHSKDGYRVAHLQAIENIYWWDTCCDNPNVVEKEHDEIYVIPICLNCGTERPDAEERSEICPKRLKEMFGDAKYFETREEAFEEACRMYNEIMNDDFCPIVEYGIQFIEYDKEFPK